MNEAARWEPFRPVAPFGDNLFDMIPTFFRPVTRGAPWPGPRMDVTETERAYLVAVELPGIPKDKIQVSVYENSLSLAAEAVKAADEPEAENWLLRERGFGKFSRSVTLPEAVDDRTSAARYADGVLYLTLQKRRASQVKRLTVD